MINIYTYLVLKTAYISFYKSFTTAKQYTLFSTELVKIRS